MEVEVEMKEVHIMLRGTHAMPQSMRRVIIAADIATLADVILWPSRLRSLSLAVTIATLLPASTSAANRVGARSHLASFIITSVPVAVSNR